MNGKYNVTNCLSLLQKTGNGGQLWECPKLDGASGMVMTKFTQALVRRVQWHGYQADGDRARIGQGVSGIAHGFDGGSGWRPR